MAPNEKWDRYMRVFKDLQSDQRSDVSRLFDDRVAFNKAHNIKEDIGDTLEICIHSLLNPPPSEYEEIIAGEEAWVSTLKNSGS